VNNDVKRADTTAHVAKVI